MRVLCITDCPVQAPTRWLWDYLPAVRDEVDFCWLRGPADRYARWGKVLAYYPTYWRLAWRALAQARKVPYDVAAAWEGKNGLPYAFLRRLLGRDDFPLVILFFSVKGVVMHFLPLVRYALRGNVHLVVPAQAEAEYYRRLLKVPAERITCSLLGNYDLFGGKVNTGGEYIFAGGRSDRDYGTFFRAVEGLPNPVIVNARRFNVAGLSVPANVTVNDLMPFDRLQRVLAGARFVVVPLQKVPHAAGLSQVILAMSAGKAVIATRAGGTEDYIEPGVNGLLVPPGDVAAMRAAIHDLLDHPEKARQMGLAARARYVERHTFPAMAQRIHQILSRVGG